MNAQQALFNGRELKELWNQCNGRSASDHYLYLALKTSPEHLKAKLERAFPRATNPVKLANGHRWAKSSVGEMVRGIIWNSLGRKESTVDVLKELRKERNFSLILKTLSDEQLKALDTLIKEVTR